MNWDQVAEPLRLLFRSLAAENMSQPIDDACVTWLNRNVPFISPDTQVGLYLQITHSKLVARPGTDWITQTDGQVCQQLRQVGRARLRVKVISLESTDTTWSLMWLQNVATNIWSQQAHDYLNALNLSIYDAGQIIDTSSLIDQRIASEGILDLGLNWSYTKVMTLPVQVIEHVQGTVTPAGKAPIDFEANE
jgi:hypothetical protein